MINMFNRNMNSKVDTNVYLLVIALLGIALCIFQPYTIPVVALVFGLTYYFSRRTQMNKEVFFSSYLDNIIRNIERTNHFAVRKLDIGMAVFSKDGKLQWKNDLFQEWVGKKNIEGLKPEDVLPLQNNAFEILSVKDGEKLIQLNDRYYNMKYCRVQTLEKLNSKNDDKNNSGLMIYLTDVTDFELLRQKCANDKLCLAYIRFDNYEDVMRGLSETNMANLNGEINELLTKWVAEKNGFICRMNKEQSLAGFTNSTVHELMDGKFEILDKVREIRSGNKIPPTISIGVACDSENLEELMQNANKAMYLALGRGGDQAVVVQNKETKFYGGTSTVAAKATRVRARIVAQTINEQMQAADKIFVMGHANEDYDAIGSAIGVAKLALSLNKETYIVISGRNDNINRICESLQSLKLQDTDEDYCAIMVEEEEALKHVTAKSLLLLVDHHREILSASKKVLEAIPNKRIIIDHHRRAEDLISDTVLLYLEPSSSSTCELITELVGYFNDRLEISPAEATAMYAGIVLDTKNFAVQTGERTFEAAALLRRSGGDPSAVRLMFKDDMDMLKLRSRLIADAKTPEPGIAISIYKRAQKGARASIIAAQTADALITIEGIMMGVAIVEYTDGSLGVSARSDGSVNVQVIMEELGGGGHQTVAGVQLDNMRAAAIEPQILALAKKQIEEKENNESNSVTGY